MASPVSLSPGVSLRLRLVAAAATANPRFTAFYADTSPEGVNTNQGQLNGSTPVVVVEAPSAGSRIVSNLIVQNRDTAALTLIQETFDGTTAAEVFRVQLQVGDFLSGGNVYDQYGSLKSGTTGPQGIQGDEGDPGTDGADGTDGTNGVDGITPGLAYNWSTATTVTPSSGQLRGNDATYSSITSLFVHESDRNGTDISAVLGQITAGTVIQLQSGTNPAKYAWFTVTSSTDNGGDRSIAVTYLASVGVFSNAEQVSLALFRKGVDGTNGTGSVNSVNNVASVSGNVTLTASSVGAESALGNPSSNGHILSSTTSGVRTWIAPPTSGGSSIAPDNPIAIFGSALRCFLTGSVTGNGITVSDLYSQWTDQSGNGNHATQSAVANRPLACRWPGTNLVCPLFQHNRFLALPNFLTAFPNRGFIWVVLNSQSPESYCPIYAGTASDPYDTQFSYFDNANYTGQLRSVRVAGLTGYSIPRVGKSSAFWYSNADGYRMYLNGAIAITDPTQSWGVPTNPLIGRWLGGTKQWWGAIAELGFCNEVPTQTQVDSLNAWIAYRWP